MDASGLMQQHCIGKLNRHAGFQSHTSPNRDTGIVPTFFQLVVDLGKIFANALLWFRDRRSWLERNSRDQWTARRDPAKHAAVVIRLVAFGSDGIIVLAAQTRDDFVSGANFDRANGM